MPIYLGFVVPPLLHVEIWNLVSIQDLLPFRFKTRPFIDRTDVASES
jgi:hypothetical protein